MFKRFWNWLFPPPSEEQQTVHPWQFCEHEPYGYECPNRAEYLMDGEYLCRSCADLAYG